MTRFAVSALALLALFAAGPAEAKTEFRLAWSIYVGWMPWQWAADHGIVKKWADKYGIKIAVVQINDYAESINQYTAGAFDALTVTEMDTLAIPAVGGVDTTAVVIGDFSNGNDAVILKDKTALADIKGQRINLVQFSVSHYLLDRGLATIGVTEKRRDGRQHLGCRHRRRLQDPEVTAVATWNPHTSEILGRPARIRCSIPARSRARSSISTIANTKTLAENP